MKLRKLWIMAAVSALAVVPATADANSNRDRATGGGQAFLDEREPAGPGDTVGFTAQRAKTAPDNSSAATGQIQVNRRGEANAIKFYGTITCLVVTGGKSMGAAFMSGMTRATKTQPAKPFELYVTDGGKGRQERNDTIALFVGSETNQGFSDDGGPCGLPRMPDALPLFRGNVQTYNASTAEDPLPVGPPILPPGGLI